MTKSKVPPPGTLVRAIMPFGHYCVKGNLAYVLRKHTEQGREHLTEMFHLTGPKTGKAESWHPTYFNGEEGHEPVWKLSRAQLSDQHREMIVRFKVKEATNAP